MFKLPENLSELSLEELAGLRVEADKVRIEIASIEDDDKLLARLEEFDEVVAAIQTIDGRIAEVEAADAERAEQLARVRAAKDESADEPTDETDPTDGEGDDDGDGDADEDHEEADAEAEERVPVTASAARRGTAARAASRAPKPAPKTEEEPKPKAGLIAAANVPDFSSGQNLESFRDVAAAFQSRSRGWARSLTKDEAKAAAKHREVRELSKNSTRHGVARIDKTPLSEAEFTVTSKMSTSEQFDIIMKAANERRLQGGLIAAGGWCAPSETIYGNFLSLETVSGILDLPTANADRGGINFTKGPDYASIAQTWGFMQTEAQAIAGTEKTCYPVACPPFEELRLDAIGFCITAGILTEAAYPELIDRVLQIGTVAHAHKVNASVISRILNYVGAAVDHVEMGSATADILDAADLQAMRLRYTYAMDPEATIESFFPVWAITLFRADLARRSGVDMLAVSRGDVERWLTARGIRAQWVYDWQNFTSASTTPAAGAAWTSLPDTLEFVMYPAGSFVKLTTNVISLDTIYDSVNTSTNSFTAAFFEEGLAVANTGASGVRVSVSVADLYGRTGAHALAAA
jgi:hypothetical protein